MTVLPTQWRKCIEEGKMKTEYKVIDNFGCRSSRYCVIHSLDRSSYFIILLSGAVTHISNVSVIFVLFLWLDLIGGLCAACVFDRGAAPPWIGILFL